MLTDRLARYFLPDVRSRGRSYYSASRVRVVSTTPDDVIKVHVDGTRRYTVLIDVDRADKSTLVQATCDCPYLDTHGDFCKHIWAALLAVEKRFQIADASGLIDLDFLSLPGEDGGLDDDWGDDTSEWIEVLNTADPRNLGVPGRPKPVPAWSRLIQDLARQPGLYEHRQNGASTEPIEPIYLLEAPSGYEASDLRIGLGLLTCTTKRRVPKIKKLALKSADLGRLTNENDRLICLMLAGAGVPSSTYCYGSIYRNREFEYGRGVSTWTVPPDAVDTLLPMLFQSGRFMFRANPRSEPTVLKRDEGEPWELFIAFERQPDAKTYLLRARLRRNGESKLVTPLQCFIHAHPAILIDQGVLSRVQTHGCFRWLSQFQSRPTATVTNADRAKVIRAVSELEHCPPIAWPDNWRIEDVTDIAPKPKLLLEATNHRNQWESTGVTARIRFVYDGIEIEAHAFNKAITDPSGARRILRQRDAENRYIHQATELGFSRSMYEGGYSIPEAKIPNAVHTLLKEGWTVLGKGRFYRTAGRFQIDVTTGIDWFDLNGQVDFDGQTVGLPELLAALRRGDKYVTLGDGSLGMLPEEWLAKHADLLGLGHVEDGKVRFAKTQVGLIDALLAEMPEARFDEKLAETRERLHTFSGIAPQQPPEGFAGTLRPYQELGLGWLGFLNTLNWGGCLADDMGLGKTVQVLAMLLERKRQAASKPSLVVVPKSIVFNWLREAGQFAPDLRVLDYTGTERASLREQFGNHDLILTTYGTCRRDIEFLRTQEFDYVILDEAQAIKNPDSLNAKSSRLLPARSRLAMTGTPVENHLGDLWSLFEFLNPGMLGKQTSFKTAFQKSDGNGRSAAQIEFLHRLLRPFILRRTKDQVAPELPERSEQTIECVMSPKQAACYAQLRDYYRLSLLGRVAKEGLAKSKVHVLEALLRLRQAACHPGLIDPARQDVESAKFDALIPMLTELREENHKVLVFSQFTSLLAILRGRLDEDHWDYEYLDGQTHDRQKRVDRFQKDRGCSLFLISLKAGGLGLNLTAADYVFILDPWWNPAVEAQAIDRAHRIGQSKRVMAYRMITRDTVESKIIQLQQSKRDLANAIITQANSLIQTLTREDLDLLLS